MKAIALTMIAAVLVTIFGPTRSQAAQKRVRKDITVMLRGEIDPAKLKKGSYAYVVYHSRGAERAAWGEISQIYPDAFVIKRAEVPLERLEITFTAIDILTTTEIKHHFEAGQLTRPLVHKVATIPGEDLDPSKLVIGWYAHVIYTRQDLKGTATGELVGQDPDGISIKPLDEPAETRTIAYSEIDTLAFTRSAQGLRRWQRWNKTGVVGMSRMSLDPHIIEKDLYVFVVCMDEGVGRSAWGRVVNSTAGRIVIQRGGDSFAQREKVEVEYDAVAAIFVAKRREGIERWTRAPGRNVKFTPRVHLKLLVGTLFGTLTATPVVLSKWPELDKNNAESKHLVTIPFAVLHAAATAGLVSMVDPLDQYKPTFAGSLLGCSVVATVALLTDPEGYGYFGAMWLGYVTVPTIAATIASERSRKPPEMPRFSVGLAPRGDGNVSALATLRF